MRRFNLKRPSVQIWLMSLCLWAYLSASVQALARFDRVQAFTVVTVRNGPVSGVIGSVIVNKLSGSKGYIIDGPTPATLNGTAKTWWKTHWDDGTEGWSVPDGLSVLPSWILYIYSSNPSSGIPITTSPADIFGYTTGTTDTAALTDCFFWYENNVVATVTAPPTAGGNTFLRWERGDGSLYSPSRTTTITMTADYGLTAVYGQVPPPAKTTYLTAYDAAGTAGQPVALKAMIEIDNILGFRDSVGGLTVEIWVEGTKVGTASSTSSGVNVSFPYTIPSAPGKTSFSWFAKFIGNATYAASQSAPQTITITIPDVSGPSLSILSHSNGQTVNTASILLSGSASDSGRGNNGISSVIVNGSRANNDTAAGSGAANWSRTVNLSVGVNQITVTARDNSPNQNATSQQISITYTPPPAVTILTAYDAAGTAGQSVELQAMIEFINGLGVLDSIGGLSVEIWVEGAKVGAVNSTSLGKNVNFNYIIPSNPGKSSFSWYAKFTGNSVYAASQSSAQTLTISIPDADPPAITITSDYDGETVHSSRLTVLGSASDSGHGNNGVSMVKVNGVRAANDSVIGAGTANWSCTLDLNPGPNTIQVSATDNSSSHNTRTSTFTIFVRLSTISGTVQPTFELIQHLEGPTRAALIQRFPFSSTSVIDPNVRTWIIIHGRTDSSDAAWVQRMASAIVGSLGSQEQVLLLDWRDGAAAIFPETFQEDWIKPTAKWAAATLVQYGFAGSDLNLIGHSWGGNMAAEIAERVPYIRGHNVNFVNTIVALDPAENGTGGYDPEGIDPDTGEKEINFSRNSRFSWAFHSSVFGSEQTPITAHESIGVITGQSLVNAHIWAHDVFNDMLEHANPVSRNFTLWRLVDESSGARGLGPWLPDQYAVDLSVFEAGAGKYEAKLKTTPDGQQPFSLTYIDKTTYSEVTRFAVEPADTQAPTLSINSPPNNATVTTATIPINGTASDSGRGDHGVTVLVNGANATSGTSDGSGTANWSAIITLTVGANQITVSAKDSLNNTVQQQLIVTYTPPDTQAPTLTIDSPLNNSIVITPSLRISGTASDNGRGNNGVTVLIDNINVSGGSADGIGTANWTATISLNVGPNSINVRAKDASNNLVQRQIAVTYAPPETEAPALVIISPLNNITVTTQSIAVSGTASDNGHGDHGVTVLVNGVNATGGTADGSAIANWSATIPLSAGANPITVVAKDSLNNMVQQQIVVTYNSPPNNPPNRPSNTLPSDGAASQLLTLTLHASAYSDLDGDPHLASQWQVLDNSGTTIVWDSAEDSINKTARSMPVNSLAYSTTYRWHVRYKDNRGAWSDYSSMTAFSTMADNQKASIVVIISPQPAVDAGARWKIDEGEWQKSGSVVAGISLGAHILSYNEVFGWTAPEKQQMTLSTVDLWSTNATFAKHHLTAAQKDNANFTFTLNGNNGSKFLIEKTSDWKNWSPVRTITLSGGAVTSPNAIDGSSQTYFRATELNDFVPPPGFVKIPAGTFTMGSPANEPARNADESPQRLINIANEFWMSTNEITQKEFQAVSGFNPSPQTGDSLPVFNVKWTQAIEFCQKLTQQERSAGRIPAGYLYRLPTEAEWEYAYRAGTTTTMPWLDDAQFSHTPQYAWTAQSNITQPQPVGGKLPNNWGLHDMGGNAWEWCSDFYGPYNPAETTDPTGPVSGDSQQSHVTRGGCWGCGADGCRAAARNWGNDLDRYYGVGFRTVLSVIR